LLVILGFRKSLLKVETSLGVTCSKIHFLNNWIGINTMMLPMARTVCDHTPCMVKIGTAISKTKIFIFECFWTEQPRFKEVVHDVWNSEVRQSNNATKVAALRRVLKRWAMNLSSLKRLTR
jgi:hypothetical protein